MCRPCARLRLRPNITWKTCIAPAVLPRFWANWIGPDCCMATSARCTARRCATDSSSGTSRKRKDEEVKKFFRAAPGGIITTIAFSQSMLYPELDTDRAQGCIRDKAHAYSRDGGLAVLHGNIALDGCIVKTAGVDESILKFSGRARVFESQDAAIGRHPRRPDRCGRCGGDSLRRSEGRAGHAGDAVSDLVPEIERHGQGMCAAYRRALFRRHVRA